MDATLEMTFKVGGETVEIWRAGVNDYWVNFIESDCSVRGTLADVVAEVNEHFGEEVWK